MALFGKKDENAAFPDMGQQAQGAQDYGQQGWDQQGYYPQQAPQMGQYPQQAGGFPARQEPGGNERMEEIAEAIVQEKWGSVEKELAKLSEWRDTINTQIAMLSQKLDDLKNNFDELHRGMLGKITEYDENLTNVGTEIKAMERVFSKVLPSLTDSVNKLQRFTSGGEAAKPAPERSFRA